MVLIWDSSGGLREVFMRGGPKEGPKRQGLKRESPKTGVPKGRSEGTQGGPRLSPKGRGYPGGHITQGDGIPWGLRSPADIKIFNSDI